MRIAPNHPRLRIVALACWSLGCWWIWQTALVLSSNSAPTLAAPLLLAAALIVALGVAYWQLSNDARAGIVFDAKGLMLNLGSSSAFVSWENIEAVGICRHRNTLLTLGSSQQLGIRIYEALPYVQSYEPRLPAARGPLAQGLALLHQALRRFHTHDGSPSTRQLARQRAQTSYDILVPEVMLGGSAEGFIRLIETYRSDPQQRLDLGRWV